jgi:hydrogenase/urease accessory protein HupE
MINIIFYSPDRSDIGLLKPQENMEKITRVAIGIICILVTPFSLLAHPGHGHENPLSPGHYVANPEHFLPLALTIGAVLIALLAYRSYLSQSKQNK